MTRTLSSFLKSVLLACVMLVTACTSLPPRTVESDSKIRKVVVISTLEDKVPVIRIGLTAFNNANTAIDFGGAIVNPVATQATMERLSKVRPNWSVSNATYDRATFLKLLKGEQFGMRNDETRMTAQYLASIAKQSGADAAIVLSDGTYQDAPAYGISILLRTFSLSTVKDASVFTVVFASLVDLQGNVQSMGMIRTQLRREVPAATLGLTYSLDGVESSPEVRVALAKALPEYIQGVVLESLSNMGY